MGFIWLLSNIKFWGKEWFCYGGWGRGSCWVVGFIELE